MRRSVAFVLRLSVGLLAVFIAVSAPAASPSSAPVVPPVPTPVVPGYFVLKDSGKADLSSQGELLLNELNCVACHAAGAQSRLAPRGAPDLSEVGGRVTQQYLRDFLSNPHAMKPGTTMPDIFHASEPRMKEGAVDFLLHFLVSQGGPIPDPLGAATRELVKQGETLYESVGCVACHAPEKIIAAKIPSVPLGELAEKTTLDALTGFLLEPTHVRPSGRMPSSNLSPAEARAIAVYLLRKQFDVPNPTTKPLPGTGINYAYYDANVTTAAPEKYLTLKPTQIGKLKNFTLDFPNRKNDDHFGVRYTGWLSVPKSGKYTFTLHSDDGAILWIDTKAVVTHDGNHPTEPGKSGDIQLKAGQHPIELTYFQNGGGIGLNVLWKGPGLKQEPIPPDVLAATGGTPMTPLKNEPFTLDPEKAKMGAQMFSVLGCAACHLLPDHPSVRSAKALAELKIDNPEGCLGEKIAKGKPKYDLSPDQRAAIVAALKNVAAFNTPLDSAHRAMQQMAAMNCFACHQRDGIGGVQPDRAELFKSTVNVDLGDDGKIPPKLTGVGAKLQPAAMDRILFKGELRIRPYIATRMPVFSNEKLRSLPEALIQADSAKDASPAAQVVPGTEKAGWQLVGVKGLGCINCHGAKGAKSIGVPGPDLSIVRERLTAKYFRNWLADPNKLVPGTRMPSFWSDGQSAIKEIGGGAFDAQANAIWTYLQQQGDDMLLPLGLRLDNADPVVPIDEPIVLRAFVTDVGPRAILVGNPEGIHWVFDANTMRLAKAWRGKFFDAAGIWESRGGSEKSVLGKDAIDMPAGPSFAILDSQGAAWPDVEGDRDKKLFTRNLGGMFKGYTLDPRGLPTFRYILNDVTILETELPKGSGDRASFERRFKLSAGAPVKDLYFLIASGKTIEPKESGAWRIDGKLTVKLTGDPLPSTEVREGKDGRKLLVAPVTFKNNAAAFSVEWQW